MKISDCPLFLRLLLRSPLSAKELSTLIVTAPYRYKEHYIHKRNGRGLRLISQPTAELKFFQRMLVSDELSCLPIHPAAKAYRKDRSILDHAAPHAGSRYLLKLDFKDFFPSLKSSLMSESLGRFLPTLSIDEIDIVCNLLFKKCHSTGLLQLSIGAPSSPFISNHLLHDFDAKVDEFATSRQMTYSRYADDIAISTNVPRDLDLANEFVREILRAMPSLGLTLNQSKTVNVSRKHRRVLTGLVLSNDGRASLGRESKRYIRAGLHSASVGRDPKQGISKLRGLLAFAYSIDPNWVESTCAKFGFLSIQSVEVRLGNVAE